MTEYLVWMIAYLMTLGVWCRVTDDIPQKFIWPDGSEQHFDSFLPGLLIISCVFAVLRP